MNKKQREEIETQAIHYVSENVNHSTEWASIFIAGASHVYKTKVVLDREVLDEVIKQLNSCKVATAMAYEDYCDEYYNNVCKDIIKTLTKLKQAREGEL